MSVEIDPAIGTFIDSDIQLLEVIGQGATSIVYLGQDSKEKEFAIKRVEKRGLNEAEYEAIQTEIEVLKHLTGHENIIRLYKVIETAMYWYMVLDFCETDLFDAIFVECGLPPVLIKRFFADICDGLQYCHDRDIYHRDLKPENILISADGVAKLADFGLVTEDPYSDEFGLGSTRYQSPECLGYNLDLDSKALETYPTGPSDVWSLGIILINMISGRNPWHEAKISDTVFKEYMFSDPDIIRRNLLIGENIDMFLRQRVFNLDPLKRCSPKEFRDYIILQDSFRENDTDDEEEKPKLHVKNEGHVFALYQSSSPSLVSTSEQNASSASSLPYISAESSSTVFTKPWLSQIAICINTSLSKSKSIGSMDALGRLKIAPSNENFMDSTESRIQLAKRISAINSHIK